MIRQFIIIVIHRDQSDDNVVVLRTQPRAPSEHRSLHKAGEPGSRGLGAPLTRAVVAWVLVGLLLMTTRVGWSVAAAIAIFVVLVRMYVAAADWPHLGQQVDEGDADEHERL